MPRAARIRSNSGIYHIIMRGINRQRVFEDEEDYERYLWSLKNYKAQCGFNLYAWCLMPNHIHLLLKEGREPLEQVFRRIGTSFVYWYNGKYERTGHLFQDRYKSEAVEDDSYFLTVLRYIHLNPVKAGICTEPSEYPYSSYGNYFENDAVDHDLVERMIGRKEFERYHRKNDNDICMDIQDEAVHRITDEQVRKLLRENFDCENVSQVQLLTEEKKILAIQLLLGSGASIRQVSRLTGISFGIVRKYT